MTVHVLMHSQAWLCKSVCYATCSRRTDCIHAYSTKTVGLWCDPKLCGVYRWCVAASDDVTPQHCIALPDAIAYRVLLYDTNVCGSFSMGQSCRETLMCKYSTCTEATDRCLCSDLQRHGKAGCQQQKLQSLMQLV